MKKHTILVIDDNDVNRKILYRILEEEYSILEAENGMQALEISKDKAYDISAILLDLIMPVMDGYAFLATLKRTSSSSIPIIVTTGSRDAESEKRAFSLGAWDFVSKPYDAQILKYRLESAIAHNENIALEKIKHMAEHDKLTGLYNRNKFFEETEMMIREHPQLSFAFVRFDVDRFSLVNTFFGNEEGDRLLQYIAKHLESFITEYFEYITYGRIEADEFAFCCAYDDLSILEKLMKLSSEDLRKYPLNFEMILTFGVYLVTDFAISARQMLDNAKLASKSAKGHFSNNYAFYDDTMGNQLIAEQEIINEMNCALQEKQFCIYLQPKYDLHTNLPAGAEALVRWNHPERGLIYPGEFIPVFEKNGFITKLDYYVWEETCSALEDMAKRDIPILPISVNVSRVHLYNPQLSELLCELLDRHHLPHELLNLELTESIYAEHSSVIQETIAKLHENGFIIMMDDFGSGYSSLNVLKDVEFDVLKIDMRFFESSAIKGRTENIVASIIRMAKWLGLPIVAEGVETSQQVQLLKGLGCEYVQGYYFAKPMPVNEYEALILENTCASAKEQPEFIVNEIWKDNAQIELMFTIIPQPLVLFEFDNDQIELLRVNQEYYNFFGYDNFSKNSLHLERVLSIEDKETVWSAVYQTIASKKINECNYLRKYSDGTHRWIHVYLRYINQVGNKHILFGTFLDVTSEVETKEELKLCKAKVKQLEEERDRALERSKLDSLTGVYNRTAIECIANHTLKSQSDSMHGFLILDLDNFKTINDTYGHIYGDKVLKEVAEILQEFFKGNHVVGRLGGDEFVAFLQGIQSKRLVLNRAEELCERLQEAVLTNKKLKISTSIGICVSNKKSDFADLYKKADKALYDAKQNGKMQAMLYRHKKPRYQSE